MKARRVPWPVTGTMGMEPGDYSEHPAGGYFAITPPGIPANLGNHTITHNEDGTLSVSPSILVKQGSSGAEWHGYLERDVWRSC